MVISAYNGHAECCLNWNVYDISVNCKFKMICMQKMNIIAKIRALVVILSQWRREIICRPGQTSVLPLPPIRSILQSGYFSGFPSWVCEPALGVPSSSLSSHFFHFPSLPSTLPFPTTSRASLRNRPLKPS